MLLRSGLLACTSLGLWHPLNSRAAAAEAGLSFEQRQQLLQQQDEQQLQAQQQQQQEQELAGAAEVVDPEFTRLMERITTPGDVWEPWPPAPWAPRMLYYPPFMFGEWHVDSTYDAFRAPLGERFLSEDLLQAARAPVEQGGVGSKLSYDVRFFSTLADTLRNQVGLWVRWGVEWGVVGHVSMCW